jgi:hypothetical protein
MYTFLVPENADVNVIGTVRVRPVAEGERLGEDRVH